jgi:hypothetical protein
MRRALSTVLAAGVVLAPAAGAGGTQVNVAATAGRVWATTGSDVVELDASSARVLRRVRTRYPYPIEVGVSDGNVWASSVENGFAAGAVTRIPFESWRRVGSPLVLPTRPVFSIAVASGVTWALVGPWKSLRIARIDQATRRVSYVRVRQDVAWIAADNSGVTRGAFGLTQRGALVRVDGAAGTRAFATVPSGTGPPAVGCRACGCRATAPCIASTPERGGGWGGSRLQTPP